MFAYICNASVHAASRDSKWSSIIPPLLFVSSGSGCMLIVSLSGCMQLISHSKSIEKFSITRPALHFPPKRTFFCLTPLVRLSGSFATHPQSTFQFFVLLSYESLEFFSSDTTEFSLFVAWVSEIGLGEEKCLLSLSLSSSPFSPSLFNVEFSCFSLAIFRSCAKSKRPVLEMKGSLVEDFSVKINNKICALVFVRRFVVLGFSHDEKRRKKNRLLRSRTMRYREMRL